MLIYLSLLDTPEEKYKFEEVYNTYKHTMLYVANGILKDEQLAEDAVHEAFIRTAKNLHKISEVSCPQTKSFLVIIVRNVSLTMLKGIHQYEVSYNEFDETLQSELILDDSILEETNIEIIISEILSLPNIYKDVIYLECIDRLSNKEISEVLKITKEAAKKRSQRGKKILIENLQKVDVLSVN